MSKWVDIKKGFISGAGFGLGISLIFGLYFLVQAVAPGEVLSPIFGPQDDDVDFQLELDCVVETGGVATCQPGFTLTGAGMTCGGNGDNPTIIPNLAAGTVSADCDGTGQTAYAVCCRGL
jgi:hypothetical protein